MEGEDGEVARGAGQDGGSKFPAAKTGGGQAVVRALVEAGADVNKARHGGWKPLGIASQQGHKTVVQILRNAGTV